MIFIGIDPGLTGAVGFIDSKGGFVDVYDLPVMTRGKTKRKLNAAGMADYIREFVAYKPVAMIEMVWAMPKQGASSGCSLGHSVGVCEGVMYALGIRTHLVTPQVWKKHFKLNSDKELARAKAIEFFPTAPLSLKKHADRAEALLMARYMYEIEGR